MNHSKDLMLRVHMDHNIEQQPPLPRENVWDYPRPPRLEPFPGALKVVFGDHCIAATNAGYRVLETSHPPVYYFPPASVHFEFLRVNPGSRSFCEFKGESIYWDLVVNQKVSLAAAWSYPSPHPTFKSIQGYLAFYASRVDAAYVNEERVQPQEGNFYGGWITTNLIGPFKGAPGSWGW